MPDLTIDHSPTADDLRSGSWTLDPVRSTVSFTVPHLWGARRVTGTLQRFVATLDHSRAAVVQLTADADSVATGRRRRDARLRGPQFLDAAHHPVIEFRSDDVVITEGRMTIDGRLSVAGRSAFVLATAMLRGRDIERELDVEVTAEIDQAQLEMRWSPLGMVGTPTQVMVRGTLTQRPQSEARGSLDPR